MIGHIFLQRIEQMHGASCIRRRLIAAVLTDYQPSNSYSGKNYSQTDVSRFPLAASCRHRIVMHESCSRNLLSGITPSTTPKKVLEATPSISTNELDFKRHSNIFNERTFLDVFRSMAVLKLCGIDMIARNSLSLMKWSRRLLGKRLYEKLMKCTFYGHFVAGSTQATVLDTIRKLKAHRIRTMILSTLEEVEGTPEEKELCYDRCLSSVLDCIKIAHMTNDSETTAQIKITGLVANDLLVKLSNITKDEVYEMIDLISNAMDGNQICDFKMAVLSSILNSEERVQLENAIRRLTIIGKETTAAKVILLVDAEYTHLNEGINIFARAMMKSFNKKLPIVWNTYQCYRKDAYENFTHDLDLLTRKFGVCFAAKIVRGAYMTQERETASRHGLPDPIHATFAETTAEYHRVADRALDHVDQNPGRSSIMFASHNHDTVRYVMSRMKSLGKRNNDPDIYFGQVLGVADHVSYILGHLGYTVYKSSAWGPVDEVMPYLHRRAMENQAVLEKTKYEIYFLWQEITHRVKAKIGL